MRNRDCRSGRRSRGSQNGRARVNKLYFGGNLDWLVKMDGESVDLVYLDPPFNSKQLTTYYIARQMENSASAVSRFFRWMALGTVNGRRHDARDFQGRARHPYRAERRQPCSQHHDVTHPVQNRLRPAASSDRTCKSAPLTAVERSKVRPAASVRHHELRRRCQTCRFAPSCRSHTRRIRESPSFKLPITGGRKKDAQQALPFGRACFGALPREAASR